MLMQKSKADTWLADDAASPERRDEAAQLFNSEQEESARPTSGG
jgi:hypothetical protein